MKQATAKVSHRLRGAQGGMEGRFRLVLVVVMAGVTLFVLGRGLFEAPDAPDTFVNGTSTSPGGHRALLHLLDEEGFTVTSSVDRLDVLNENDFQDPEAALALLEPSPQFLDKYESEVRGLFSRSWRPPLILVLPKRHYHALQSDEDGTLVLQEGIYSIDDSERVLQLAGLGSELGVRRVTGGDVIEPDSPYATRIHDESDEAQVLEFTSAASPWRKLITDSRNRTLAAVNPLTRVVVLAEPDLISNRFLDQGDSAALARHVFEASQCRHLVVDEALHGMATRASLEYLAVRPPALWALLSVLLLLALFAWREATVLRTQPAEVDARRSREFVIEGVARLMLRAKDFRMAAQHLQQRAPLALLPSRAHVHAAGVAGSTSASLPGEVAERLHQLPESDGSEEHLIRVARRVAEIRREVSLSHHVPSARKPG